MCVVQKTKKAQAPGDVYLRREDKQIQREIKEQTKEGKWKESNYTAQHVCSQLQKINE